ncbi:MAG: 23S rRNA (pseudouridine(1915)-N(3))-methyltransferase RlmH [Thermovirgaceae bacterium]
MKIRIRAAGTTKTPYYRDGIADYLRRLQKHLPVSIEYVQAKSGRRKERVKAVAEEGKGLIEGVLERDHVVLLDAGGRMMGSESFSKWLYRTLGKTDGSLVFCIGGAYGVSRELRDRADSTISLSTMTLPHELCLLFFMEQLYRAAMIRAGASYHH